MEREHGPRIPESGGSRSGGLLLLLVGIHNAWDSVTYLAIDRPGADGEKQG